MKALFIGSGVTVKGRDLFSVAIEVQFAQL